jgi:photosystem II stability/assembly factor-like uncharacterized protein
MRIPAHLRARIVASIRSAPSTMRAHPGRTALAALLVAALLSGGAAFAHARSAGTYLMTDDQHPQIYVNYGKTELSPGEPYKMKVIVASISRDATLTLRPLTFAPYGLQRHLHAVGETAILTNFPFPNRSYSRPYTGPLLPPRPLDGFRLPPGMTALVYLDAAADQPGFYFIPTVTVNADAPPVLGLPNTVSATYAFDNSMCVEISQQSCDASTEAAFTTTPHPAQHAVQLWDGSSPALTGVAALSPNDVWVVGALGIILHYHNGTWTQAANPAGPIQLRAIAMVAPNEGWAVGDQGVILHYHDGTWTQVKSPPEAFLLAVTMLSPTEGWAAGEGGSGSVGAILHYSGGVWTPVPAPPGPVWLDSIAMVSPTDGWIGSDAGLLHYAGSSWKRVITSADNPNPRFITSLAIPWPRSAWALGDIILYYNGSAWHDDGQPPGFSLVRGAAMVSATDGWAVGNGGGQGNADQGVILRYSRGSWQQVDQSFDTDLSAVSMDAPSDAWAVGAGVILHYTHGTWTEVSGPIDVHGA